MNELCVFTDLTPTSRSVGEQWRHLPEHS